MAMDYLRKNIDDEISQLIRSTSLSDINTEDHRQDWLDTIEVFEHILKGVY